MPADVSRRYGTPFERAVLAFAALIVLAAIATIADVNRRMLRPIGASDREIAYALVPARPDRPGDAVLAQWAFDHWADASNGRLRFRRTDDPADALITIRWHQLPVRGRYGEMRPMFTNGRRTATITVHPDVEALGPAAVELAEDAVFRDVLVYLTCLHEIGHALGLSHTNDRDDIMFAFRHRADILGVFERYRSRLDRRADIRTQSAISERDAERLRRLLTY